MQSIDTPSVDEAIASAHLLLACDEAGQVDLIHRLRENSELCRTVRGFNHLLQRPEHHPLGLEALRRFGLEYAG